MQRHGEVAFGGDVLECGDILGRPVDIVGELGGVGLREVDPAMRLRIVDLPDAADRVAGRVIGDHHLLAGDRIVGDQAGAVGAICVTSSQSDGAL